MGWGVGGGFFIDCLPVKRNLHKNNFGIRSSTTNFENETTPGVKKRINFYIVLFFVVYIEIRFCSLFTYVVQVENLPNEYDCCMNEC